MELNPLIPFEPIETNKLPNGENWVAQVKWDGVRVLTYFDGNIVKLYNRRINERTFHYPELTNISAYCSASSIILDGEIIALGLDGKPSFSQVMRRDGIRRLERVKDAQKQVHITYMIFDVIFADGEWVHKKPLKNRLELLDNIVKPSHQVQLVPIDYEIASLFEVAKEHQLEGIVVKDLNSSYLINGKDSRWQKKKNFRDLVAIIGGVTLRAGIVNAVLLGLYDNKGQLWYIGHAGTGKLSNQDWKALTKIIEPLKITEMPFVNRPERLKTAIWVKPQIAVKIQYMNWTSGNLLRQPSIQAFVEVPPEECVFI
ncbi:MAG: RNA ligase family protein [Bacillota bacterium]|nr:RNA ligase family protein [Bacillota bacterium]